MRVLIAGAGGFLGGALARRLAARDDVELIAWAREPLAGFARSRCIDLQNSRAVAFAMGEDAPDVVVQAASGTLMKRRDGLWMDSQLTTNVAAAMGFFASHARLLLLSSAAIYGAPYSGKPWRETNACTPVGPYAEAKDLAEHSAQREADRAGFALTTVRLFNVVAPEPHGQQVFDTFLRRAAAVVAGPAPPRVRMGPLGSVRDFVAVDDVLAVIERVIEREVWGETINVCTGVGRTARELLEATAALLPGEVTIEEEDGPAGLDWSVGDPARCEALLGLRPTGDLSAITRGAAEWIVANAESGADARSDA